MGQGQLATFILDYFGAQASIFSPFLVILTLPPQSSQTP